VADDPKAWEDEDVHLGVPEEPEQVLEQDRVPPPDGSKKVVLKFRSVSSMVIAPASTGRESRSRKAVMSTDHTKSGRRCMVIPGPRMLKMVVMKLIAPRMLLAPDTWRLKIARSTAPPECALMLLSGGYTVHPVPAPTSTSAELSSSTSEGGSSQKLMLFMRGKAMSGLPISRGTIQFPKPPIRAGITMKKIMRKACAVITTL
jgi:hypothetical protein